jgi:uncharacterized protein YkwD
MTRPRTLLAGLALAVVLALTGTVSSGPFAGPATAAAAKCPGANKLPRHQSRDRAASRIVCLINKVRHKHGKPALRRNGGVGDAARRHTRHMQRKNCFAHECPGEPDLTGRLYDTKYLPCNCSWGAGENIAWGKRRKGTPRGIFKAWMNSPPHRAAILEGSFRDVGVGVRWGSPFQRHGARATYTMDFGYKH